jgi:hypothetical protein
MHLPAFLHLAGEGQALQGLNEGVLAMIISCL